MMLHIFLGLFLINADLIDYKNDEYHFECKMAKNYSVEPTKSEEKFASIEILKIEGSQEIIRGILKGNLLYRVVVEKFTKKPIIEEKKFDFHNIIVDYSKHLTSGSIIGNELNVISSSEKGDTLIYVLKNNKYDLIEHRKIIVYKDISYCLSIMTRSSFLNQEDVEIFFNSFKINK